MCDKLEFSDAVAKNVRTAALGSFYILVRSRINNIQCCSELSLVVN